MSHFFSPKFGQILASLCLAGWLLLAASTSVKALASDTGIKDPEEYNYLPLAFHGNSFDWLSDGMVYGQGYEAQCALPQWKISPQLLGEYMRFFELFPSAVLHAKGDPDNYEIRLSQASIPMLRGSEDYNDTDKISSLEAFFGVANPLLPQHEENSSGIIQNLITLGEQCQAKMSSLAAIDNLCDRLESSTCYMDRMIPDTEVRILELNERLVDYEKKYLAKMEQKNKLQELNGLPKIPVNFCDDFVKNEIPNQNSLFDANPNDYKKYSTAVLNAPVDIDSLYRIAFLVIAPTQNIDEGGEDVFWFLHPEAPNDENIKPPIIAAFKIPDFGTNKSYALKPYKDSGQLVRRVLNTAMNLETQDGLDWNARFGKAGKVLKAKDEYKTNPKALIYCPGITPCNPPSILNQTIIAIVNGLGRNCDGIDSPYEEAGEIATSANLSHTNRDYKFGWNDYGSQEATQGFNWSLTIDKDFLEKEGYNDAFGDGYEYSVEVNAWVVAPVGVEMQHLEGALRAFFRLDNYSEAVKKNCLPDQGDCGMIPLRYPIKSGGGERVMGFNATSTSRRFQDGWEVVEQINPATGKKEKITKPKFKRVVLTLIETRKAPGVRGARVGWLIRKIQEAVRPIDLQIKCSRTEDLFLGKCQVQPLGDPVKTVACIIELPYSDAITQNVMKNKEEFLKEIKSIYPDTKMDSELFDYVVEYAKSIGWNPALFLAIGREETAWGAVGSPHWLGCGFSNSDIPDKKLHAKQQMDCVDGSFNTGMSCSWFLCQYGEGVFAESCVLSLNPHFPEWMQDFYKQLVAP